VARIRIIDEWLRSPVSSPSRHRSVMVVAESWAEQRVLMRAFAASGDQTRPTIVLYGFELAIGPAGLDAHGEWGIHVEPPADGRAQDLRNELEMAARRLAGSRGNPPRLADEATRFESKATHLWAPGTPPDLPAGPRAGHAYYEPAEMVPRPVRPRLVPGNTHPPFASADRATLLAGDGHGSGAMFAASGPGSAGASMVTVPDAPLFGGAAAAAVGVAPPMSPGNGGTSVGSRTQPGFGPAGPTPERLGPVVPRAPAGASTHLAFVSLVGRTMPLGLQLVQPERDVLDALGRAPALSADDIARIVGTDAPVPWMERFLVKLSDLGLDLIHAGVDRTGAPTYILRR